MEEQKNCVEERLTKEMEEMLKKHPKQKDSLIAILNEVQETYGYIPKQCQLVISEKLGIEYTKRGIVANDKMQTSNKNVFAIGDVNGKVMLAHTAYKEAEVCASSILGENNYVNYNNIPSVLYSTPECAWVGLSEQNISNFDNYEIKKLPMIYSGRFVAENLSNVSGLCKIIIDKSKNTIVGACLIGDGASEIILAISNLEKAPKVEFKILESFLFNYIVY